MIFPYFAAFGDPLLDHDLTTYPEELFRRLSEEDLRKIARMLLDTLAERMQVLGISLEVTDDCVALLARKGYDGKMGARPLRRLVRTLIEDPAAVQLLQGQLRAGDTLLADGAQALPGIFVKKSHTRVEGCSAPTFQ